MSDTIAAVSTSMIPSAIGIVRLSGENAIHYAEALFTPLKGTLSQAEERKLVFGTLRDNSGKMLDQCLVSVSRGKHSYTGEDLVELQCHGSPVVLSETLKALFELGARQALPGEFTKRAFLNGRMDLTSAEAVIDLIDAETAQAAHSAVCQLSGSVLRQIEPIYTSLIDIMAHFHAVIDYPDEDIAPLEAQHISETLRSADSALTKLSGSFERGRIMKNGVRCAIIGRPNAGKSSLLNALLGFERAIVTDIPGTTRDTVEDKVKLGSLMLRLTDTAGLRSTDDVVESIGIERAKGAAREAQLVLAVFDGSAALGEEDMETITQAQMAEKAIAVINKSDLPDVADIALIREKLGEPCFISALKLEGLEELEDRIKSLFPDGGLPLGDMITNERQAAAINSALTSVSSALSGFESGITPDAVLTETESAANSLGELTGKTVKDDIVENIFSRFCVGK